MSDYVGLNVGGKIYRTSRLTLTRYPDSFFSSLLDGGMPSEQDDQGNYLIDQDGEIFRHALNFLRYGELELPEGFSELGLLRRQADFFLLQALKESIERHASQPDISIGRSIGLMFDDGKLFNTTKETLSKEDSFFTKMLKGEAAVSRDSHGNYIMDRDGSLFHHILNYLRAGGIFNPVTSAELARLEEDAKYFGLDVFGNHIQSIKSRSPVIHVYFCLPSPCVAYISDSARMLNIQAIRDVLDNKFTFIINVQSGVVNMDKINPNGPASLQDVEDFFKAGLRQIYRRFESTHVRLNCNCIRLEMKLYYE